MKNLQADPYPSEDEVRRAKAEGITIRQLRDRAAAAPAKKRPASRAAKPVPPELPALRAGEIRVTFPMPPSLTNSGKGRSRNGAAVAGEKKNYYAHLDRRLMARLLPDPPSTPIAFARASATLYLGNAMDEDNAMARCKWPIDWLVTRGYLASDSRQHLRWSAMPDQFIARGQEYRITITLSPEPSE